MTAKPIRKKKHKPRKKPKGSLTPLEYDEETWLRYYYGIEPMVAE